MAIFIYGTKAFTSFKGYYGQKEECEHCHRVYKKGYMKINRWVHIDYIPFFPIGGGYFKYCPICGNGVNLKSKEAKQEMNGVTDPESQQLKVYAKHILANKPKGFLETDNSYELWVRDEISGEDILLLNQTTKDVVKNVKKNRGLKILPIVEVQ